MKFKKAIKILFFTLLPVISFFLPLQNSIIRGFDIYPDGSAVVLIYLDGADNRYDVLFMNNSYDTVSTVSLNIRGAAYLQVSGTDCYIKNERNECSVFDKQGHLIRNQTLNEYYHNKSRIYCDEGEYLHIRDFWGGEKIIFRTGDDIRTVYELSGEYKKVKLFRCIFFFGISCVMIVSVRYVLRNRKRRTEKTE